MRLHLARLVLVALLALTALEPGGLRAETPTLVTGTAEVRDGDTLLLEPFSIRLHGIDAPEEGQRCATPSGGTRVCGAVATTRLNALAGGWALTCRARDVDRYGRVVATCAAAGGAEDVSAVLAREGLTWAFLEYSGDYVDQEAGARAAEIGIWQAPTQTAEAYRADR